MFSLASYDAIAAGTPGDEFFAFGRPEQLALTANKRDELALTQYVSGNYFDALRVGTATGRLPRREDADTTAGALMAVVSFGFSNRTFGKHATALGNVISVGERDYTIVGVAPPEFYGTTIDQAPDLWLPLDRATYDTDRPALTVMSRRGPGQTNAAIAERASTILNRSLGHDGVQDDQRVTVTAASRGLSSLRTQFARPLTVLMLLVGFVLLIACANVASLLLARLTSRAREIATRLALGAGRWRVFRQVFLESLLVAILGGAAGLAFALAIGGLLVQRIAAGSASLQLSHLSPGLDARTLAFAAAVSALAGATVGLIPAWIATRPKSAANPGNLSIATQPLAASRAERPRGRAGRVVVHVADLGRPARP